MYTQKLLQHFQNPKNYGKIKKPDAIGRVGNIMCGDLMILYLKIDKNQAEEEIIKEVKFETFGCAAAIATSSIITQLAKNKTIQEAIKINKDKIIESLGGLPPLKIHCSILAVDALGEALYNYFVKHKRKIPEELRKRHLRIKKERELIKEKFGH